MAYVCVLKLAAVRSHQDLISRRIILQSTTFTKSRDEVGQAYVLHGPIFCNVQAEILEA